MREQVHVPTGDELANLTARIPEVLAPGTGATAPGRAVVDDGRARYRDDSQRDRDRVLYSSAFQRLGGVTQVSESEPGHTFHTRLTHSLKVAQLTRRLVEKLEQQAESGDLVGAAATAAEALDPDAAEAAALAHDLGHPPFGHVAEDVLAAKADSAGGFQGNAQSFRIVTHLAIRRADQGLALTRRTLDGTLKYPYFRDAADTKRDRKYGAYREGEEEAFNWVRQGAIYDQPSLTARLMDWADDVTYAVHDLDDFYRAGLVPLEHLQSGTVEFTKLAQRWHERAADPPDTHIEADGADALLVALGDVMTRFPLEDAYTGRLDQRAGLRDFASVLITDYLDAVSLADDGEGNAVLLIDDEAEKQVAALKEVTWSYVVLQPSLAVLQAGRKRVISDLFDWYYEAARPGGDRRLIPPAYQERYDPEGTEGAHLRLVTDLVAGLTEMSALELYRRMSGVDPGTLLDAAARIA
jgi:dGTPase